MKKYLWLILIVLGFNLSYKVFAFEDNPPKPMNSSFLGNISNSMVNDSYGRDDLQEKTDSAFVGENTVKDQDTQFAGDSYQQQVGNTTDTPFAGDGTFVGKDYGK